MTVIVFAVLVLTFFIAGFAVLLRRLFASPDDNQSHADWLTDFSIDVYRPMERLLHEDDYTFLAAQPGFRPSIAKELRAERRKIFRSYLRQLISDFNRLVHLANLVLVYSQVDRPDLARNIASLRLQFYWAVIRTEASLTLQPLHIRPVSAQALIGVLDLMRENVAQLAPQA